ncbi:MULTISPECIES: hypothetical protein [unclassified Limnobacter]|uniref:hypothetical protein n=1 Tax=unclassified Limnobacter TaxID=2630203 RepID=UPI0025C3255C|nr:MULTISPECIES: hypothetical protein [unclassified Limnobacter]|tara:strand:- start:482 stop:655 length:174 start_codon:yes stop_codon:yes gene_type:complete
MNNSQKFFEENVTLISPQKDPVLHNLNAGLLALSREQSKTQAQVEQILEIVERLARQ